MDAATVTADVLLPALRADGFTLHVGVRGLEVRPASRLSPDQRAAIRAVRDDLIALLAAGGGGEIHAPAPLPGDLAGQVADARAEAGRLLAEVESMADLPDRLRAAARDAVGTVVGVLDDAVAGGDPDVVADRASWVLQRLPDVLANLELKLRELPR